MARTRRRLWRVGLTVHVALVLAIAISAYAGVLPTSLDRIPHFDLFGHAVLIGLIAFFLDGALGFRPLIPGRTATLRLAPALVLAVAALEESLQALSPRRSASLADFAADAVGVLVLSELARLLDRRLSRRHAEARGSPSSEETRP